MRGNFFVKRHLPLKYLKSEQIEGGNHVDSFNTATVAAMRQNPDIILIGEMRDLDTIQNAVTLAEAGHLVFGTLHAKSILHKLINKAFGMDAAHNLHIESSEIIENNTYKNGIYDIAEDDVSGIVNLVNQILRDAVENEISDIHFEPQEDCLCVRFRSDGLMTQAVKIPKSFTNQIINRIKTMAALDVNNSKIVQDGNVRLEISGKLIDLRISVLPAISGEIRDPETAEIATAASNSGHMVFSTLHTSSAASSVVRLVNMGIEPYMVASTLVAVINQRLVRRICPHCKYEYELERHSPYRKVLGCERADITLFRGAGCDACDNTGYKGRLAVQEFLIVDDTIRELLYAGANTMEIEKAAISGGMQTIRRDGIEKALAGLTTLEELHRVVYFDEL